MMADTVSHDALAGFLISNPKMASFELLNALRNHPVGDAFPQYQMLEKSGGLNGSSPAEVVAMFLKADGCDGVKIVAGCLNAWNACVDADPALAQPWRQMLWLSETVGQKTEPPTLADVASDMSGLSEHEYDRQRKGAAKALSVRVTVLDRAVERARKGKSPEKTPRHAPMPDAVRNSDKPIIRWIGGELPSIVGQAEQAMLADSDSGPAVYQRGAMLVRTARVSSDSVAGHIRRDRGALQIVPVDGAYLLERFTRAAQWLKHDARSNKWIPTNANKQAVETYLSRLGEWNCPSLTGVVESPTMRPDGSILENPGYDEKTGLIFDPGATAFQTIPDAPTKDDAVQSVKSLLEPFRAFPFVAEHDRAVLLSAILTALVRRSLRSAPMFAFSAPVMATGKSLLADCVSLIATGRRAAAWTYTPDPDEERKHITSALLSGDPVICIDNVSSPIDSDRLCSVMTQESIRDRLLGSNREVTLSTSATWLVTGNNLEIRGDLATRALTCCLDSRSEKPEEREFKVDLYSWIPANRPALVRSALTILRAYHVTGRPRQDIRQFGRFETWSDLVRSSLVWSGADDPCMARAIVSDADPERQQFGALLAAWYAVFPGERVTTAQVIKASRVEAMSGRESYAIQGGDALRDALMSVAGDHDRINPRIFGRYLAKRRNRMVMGYRLEQPASMAGVAVWLVRRDQP